MEKKSISLYELSQKVQNALESNLPILMWVTGEISDYKENPSGHCYIELIEKNETSDQPRAKFRGTIWARNFRTLKPYFEITTGVELTSGLKVLVQCSVNFHSVYGLSLNIVDIDPTYTLGDMETMRQQTISKLLSDGVMDMNKENPLPPLPKRIAVISSATAAGYEDFIHQLKNNPFGYHFETELFQSIMQGEKAEASIINSLDLIHESLDEWDMVAIIRGGGSQIDLACFDGYALASTIAQFPIPVITGIGHEKDYTIADMVAHTRAKTPTAVAEFLINRFNNAEGQVIEQQQSFVRAVSMVLLSNKQYINEIKLGIAPTLLKLTGYENNFLHQQFMALGFAVNLQFRSEQQMFSDYFRRITLMADTALQQQENKILNTQKHTLKQAYEFISHSKSKLIQAEKIIHAHNPQNVLERGFSLTRKNGAIVTTIDKLQEGDEIETTLAHGKIKSSVKHTHIK